MPERIVPESFRRLLGVFTGCFGAPSYRNFELLVVGWVHCLGRRTVTAVALASGAVGRRHISVFHRFFSRATWAPDELGRVLFQLAVAWVPAEQPLYLVLDDTLARKSGKGVALASMHHDPLLSTRRKPFFSFGHVWVVLALWVPLPMGSTHGFAVPIVCRLFIGAKRGGQRDAPSRAITGARLRAAHAARPPVGMRPTKLELARELIALVAGWASDRPVYVAVDSAYAGRELLRARPANVHLLSRLRLDAALWARPQRRRPGQTGRPRRRGTRVPAPQVLAATWRHWRSLPVTLYGQQVTPSIFALTALWYAALPEHPIHIVVVRDPRPTAGRGVLLYRHHRDRDVHPRGLCPALDPGSDVPRRQAAPRPRRFPGPVADRRAPHRPHGLPGLRAGLALVRREDPRHGAHGLGRSPLVPCQDGPVLPRHADHTPARRLAPLPFYGTGAVTAPAKSRLLLA